MILCFQSEDLSKIFLVSKFEMNRPNVKLIITFCAIWHYRDSSSILPVCCCLLQSRSLMCFTLGSLIQMPRSPIHPNLVKTTDTLSQTQCCRRVVNPSQQCNWY